MPWPIFGRSNKASRRLAARHSQEGRAAEAFAIWLRLAKRESAEACYHVGRSYLEGKAVPISRSSARYWLEKAAQASYVEAQTILAELALRGVLQHANLFESNATGEPDFDTALRWSQKAATAGSPNGQALLAYILTHGPDTMQNPREARYWYERAAAGDCAQGHFGYALSVIHEAGRTPEVLFHLRKAADKGSVSAIYLLGVMTEHGIGTLSDPLVAIRLYRQAADAGHHNAQGRLGAMLLNGTGADKNPILGESLLRRAALAGDGDAAALIARIYASFNYIESAIWLERAALAGHQKSAYLLALMYHSGTGIAYDLKQAVHWFNVAATKQPSKDLAHLVLTPDTRTMAEWLRMEAEAGDHIAELNYAICFAKGFDGARDEAVAIEYFRRAAPYIPNARYWYGLMVAEGRGIALNLVEARDHFSIAIKGGQTDAAVALGEMLINGRGGSCDVEQAIALFQWAADRGSRGASFALGVLHTGKYDIPADLAAARAWFLTAARLGHAESMIIVGEFLAAGIGGDKDTKQARHWFDAANNPAARLALERLNEKAEA
jgi:TPR repeat protein